MAETEPKRKCKPTLTDEDLSRGFTKGSQGHGELLKTYQHVKQIYEQGDLDAMFAAFEQCVRERGKITEALLVGMNLRSPEQHGYLSRQHDENAIAAMRDVSLAAVDLARHVFEKAQK